MSKKVAVLTLLLLPLSAPAQQLELISKCQDAQGNWYYGQGIDQGCDSTITILNQNGVLIREQSPFRPISLQQRQREKALEVSDQRILKRYSSVESILAERARKKKELSRQQKVNQELIDKMDRDAQQLISRDSPTATAALQERRKAISQYRAQRNKLRTDIQKLDSSYETITTEYLQALSRQAVRQTSKAQ